MSEPLGTPQRPLHVAVVGAGPSGFYTVAALFKQSDVTVEVDLFDRLPTPYGLVRGGVAPDHQSIKNVIRVYRKLADEPGFRFFGNVKVGRDVTVAELRELYDQVVFAVGNEGHRQMGVPGEELAGVHSATEFVGWYNGHPDYSHLAFPLDRVERVAVVGNGNVAMDVTRVLGKDPEELAGTDMADYAVEALRQSSVRDIVVLGRRGPAQAAFTTKEIKEIGGLDSADVVIPPEAVDLDPLSARWLEEVASPGARRNVEYLTEKSRDEPQGRPRRITFCFLVSPVEFIGRDGRLESVRLERNELFEDADGTPRPRGTGERWVEPFQLVFTAVGYRGIPIPGLPFRERRGIVPNEGGRVVEDGDAQPGLYVSGWAKRGPTGLIGSNVADANETVEHMLEDLGAGRVPSRNGDGPSRVPELLDEREVPWVSFTEWERLDELEVASGEKLGKIREKFHDVEAMLAALGKG